MEFYATMLRAFESTLEALAAQGRDQELGTLAEAVALWEDGASPQNSPGTLVLLALDAVLMAQAGGIRGRLDAGDDPNPTMVEVLAALAQHHGVAIEPFGREVAVLLALDGHHDLAAVFAEDDEDPPHVLAQRVLDLGLDSASRASGRAQAVVQQRQEWEAKKRQLVGEAVRGVAVVGAAVVSMARERKRRARSPRQDKAPPRR